MKSLSEYILNVKDFHSINEYILNVKDFHSMNEYIKEQQIDENKLENINKLFNSVESLKSLSNSKDEKQLETFINDLKNDYGEYLNIEENDSNDKTKNYIIKFTKNKLEDAEFVLAVKNGKWTIAVEKGKNLLKRISGMWKKTAEAARQIFKSDDTISEKTMAGLKLYFKSIIDYATV